MRVQMRQVRRSVAAAELVMRVLLRSSGALRIAAALRTWSLQSERRGGNESSSRAKGEGEGKEEKRRKGEEERN